MIRDLLIRELSTYGATEALADRLLLHGEKAYVTWLTAKYIDTKDVTASLEMFAKLTGKPFTQIRNAHFRSQFYAKRDITTREEYPFIISTLCEKYPFVELWVSLLPYAFNSVRRLAIELAIANGMSVKDIVTKMNVSQSFVYKIQKEYFIYYVQLKADCNDTEYDR